jgi:hypothetical protein
MQPDDPSITPVSTAAAATAFSIFLVLMDHAFLLVRTDLPKLLPDDRMLSRSIDTCAILRKQPERLLFDHSKYAPSQPTDARQLVATLDTLSKRAQPRGKLAAVKSMTTSSSGNCENSRVRWSPCRPSRQPGGGAGDVH